MHIEVPPQALDGPLVTLMHLGFADANALLAALDAAREHIRGATDWAATIHDKNATKLLQGRIRSAFSARREFHFGAYYHGQLIGACGYYLEGPWHAGQAEIGGWILPAFARKGIARTTTKMLLQWGFEVWGFSRIFVRIPADMTAALALVHGLGFRPEGVLVEAWDAVQGRAIDMHQLAMLAREWPSRQKN